MLINSIVCYNHFEERGVKMTKKDKFIVGQRIKELRLKTGLTLDELGNLLGTSKSIISRWENGISLPSPNKLKKITETLGVTLEQLFDGTDIISSEVMKNDKNIENIFNYYNFLTSHINGGIYKQWSEATTPIVTLELDELNKLANELMGKELDLDTDIRIQISDRDFYVEIELLTDLLKCITEYNEKLDELSKKYKNINVKKRRLIEIVKDYQEELVYIDNKEIYSDNSIKELLKNNIEDWVGYFSEKNFDDIQKFSTRLRMEKNLKNND